MIKHGNISRRNYLHILVCLSALGLARSTRTLAIFGGRSESETLTTRLTEIFRHRESASVIGREFLRCVPAEADEHLLIDLICSSRKEQRAKLARANSGMLREWILRQHRKDFENGRIVNIQGWLLSKTEVRVCALLAFHKPDACAFHAP
jgi:hypothetical protein